DDHLSFASSRSGNESILASRAAPRGGLLFHGLRNRRRDGDDESSAIGTRESVHFGELAGAACVSLPGEGSGLGGANFHGTRGLWDAGRGFSGCAQGSTAPGRPLCRRVDAVLHRVPPRIRTARGQSAGLPGVARLRAVIALEGEAVLPRQPHRDAGDDSTVSVLPVRVRSGWRIATRPGTNGL